MEKSIYLVGDSGEYNEHTYNIFNTINKDCKKDDSLVLLGDNFYPYGVSSEKDKLWKNISKINSKLPIYPILGNHDYLMNPYAQIRHRSSKYKWCFPFFYYKLTINNFDLFFIDTCILQPNYSNLTEEILDSKIHNYKQEREDMINWLVNGLSKSTRRKIVLGHYPIVSVGLYGFNLELYKMLIDIFKKYNVEMYVSGHDHNLQIHNVKTDNYTFKHLVSGSASSIYKCNNTNNIFFKHGYIKLVTDYSQQLQIIFYDEYGSKIYSEIF
jgi:predicted MPP superfamily phosphohydrolase